MIIYSVLGLKQQSDRLRHFQLSLPLAALTVDGEDEGLSCATQADTGLTELKNASVSLVSPEKVGRCACVKKLTRMMFPAGTVVKRWLTPIPTHAL